VVVLTEGPYVSATAGSCSRALSAPTGEPMQVVHLQIDGQSFFLEPDEDVDALEALILSAVLEGPSFIKFRAAGYGIVSVLVTPRIGVRFDTREVGEDEVADWSSHPPDIDVQFD
jgi:hypothetical protein